MLHKKNFDVEKNLARLESRMFGIDLHWMPHCHGSIEVAKILKRLHPHVPISFGGLSSSIFHEDLIAYDCIDYVLRPCACWWNAWFVRKRRVLPLAI